MVQARADDNAARMPRRRFEQARQVGRIVLAVAVDGEHAARTTRERFGEAGAQCRALAAPLRVAQHGHRQVAQAFAGAIVRTVVDHDHPRTVAQGVFDHVANPQRLVQRRDHHRHFAGAPLSHG